MFGFGANSDPVASIAWVAIYSSSLVLALLALVVGRRARKANSPLAPLAILSPFLSMAQMQFARVLEELVELHSRRLFSAIYGGALLAAMSSVLLWYLWSKVPTEAG